ncbi:hypothetical protein AB0C33_22055 [Nonomuraea sp. NPDC048881]|uniref:hypothetical protein n=1 Tax=Nonomuraea sp. NPDC048881 TaxID=3155030 RepID=UPI0033C115AA
MQETFSLFERLLDIACRFYSDAGPVAVIADAGESNTGIDFRAQWRTTRTSVNARTLEAVAEEITAAPVVLLPPLTAPKNLRNPWPAEELISEVRVPSPAMPLVLIVPASFLSSVQHSNLRRTIAQHWQISLIVIGSDLLDGVDKRFRAAALFLWADKEQQHQTKFFSLPDSSPGDREVLGDFRNLLKRRTGRGTFGYVPQGTVTPAESLGFSRYDPQLLDQRDNLKSFGTLTRLGDLFDIQRGPFHLAHNSDLISDDLDVKAIPLLSGREITRRGEIEVSDEARRARVQEDWLLRSGDIVLREIYGRGDRGGLIAAKISEYDLPLAATQHVITLRAKPTTDDLQRSTALQLLRMPLARKLVIDANESVGHLRLGSLAELPIPQLSDELRTVLENLKHARSRFETWQAECSHLLNSIFEGDSPEKARLRLLSSGRKIRLRSNAAAALDDNRYLFRTRLPYPIAYRWRLAEATLSAGPSREAYTAILDVAEILACYSALAGLAFARSSNISIGYVGNLRASLGRKGNGPGLGDWVAILREIRDSKLIDGQAVAKPLVEMRLLLAPAEVDDALQSLKQRRNDESHQRRISKPEVSAFVDSAFDELSTLLKASLFLAELPLICVTSSQWDSFQGNSIVHYQEFMGDHSVVPVQAMSYSSSELEIGSLYILDDQRSLHLLRPYLIGTECPTCHVWSTFHLDELTSSGPRLKSLEHGHVFVEPNLRSPLSQVGLL